MLSCTGRDTVSYYHTKTKKEYFPNFSFVIFLSQTARAFSDSFAPSMRLVSLVTLCHTAYSGHVLLCPLQLFLLFWAISGLHPGNLSEASRRLLKIAGPQAWHRCKAQPHREGSRPTQEVCLPSDSSFWLTLLTASF